MKAGRSLSTVIVVAAVAVLLFGSMYPNLLPSTLNPEWSVTIDNGSSTPYTLRIMTWASLALLPLVLILPGLDVLGVPQADQRRRDTRLDRIVEAPVLTAHACPDRPAAVARLGGDASFPCRRTVCGVLTAACTIASAVVLAGIVAGVITDPRQR